MPSDFHFIKRGFRDEKKLKIYLTVIYLIFLFSAVILFSSIEEPLSLLDMVFFILVLFFSNNITYLINSITIISTSILLPILFPAMLIFEPFWVGLIAFFGTIELKYRDNKFIWYQFLFNRTMLFITASSAAVVFRTSNLYFTNIILSFLFTSIIYFILNNLLVFLVIRIAEGKQNTSFSYLLQLSKTVFISVILGLLTNFIYLNYGKLIFILTIAIIFLIKDFIYTNIKQLNSSTQLIESFLKVIDSKDHYTEDHCKRVAKYSKTLCENLGIAKVRTERIVNIAKIHDIGKIKIPDKILKSSARLTDEEYKEIKNHSLYGYQLIKEIDLLKKDLLILLHHHEHYDGNGYPEGKKEKDIPFGARILTICDAFDVMTSGRSYKPAMSKKEIIQEYKDCSGKQFDPELSKKMIELINKGIFDNSFKKLESSITY